MLVVVLLVMSVFIAIEPDNFNQVFDGITLLYVVGVIGMLGLYHKRSLKGSENEEDPDAKTYVWKKRSKNLTWQEKMSGTWTKIERTNFYEFMLWNGAPSFVASMQKDSAFGQVIEFDPKDDKTVKLTNTGFPAATGVWIKVCDSFDTAIPIETKDPQGRAVTVRCWYDETEHELHTKGYNIKDKVWVHQTRKIDENGFLYLTLENTRESDNASIAFQAKFKKTAST